MLNDSIKRHDSLFKSLQKYKNYFLNNPLVSFHGKFSSEKRKIDSFV